MLGSEVRAIVFCTYKEPSQYNSVDGCMVSQLRHIDTNELHRLLFQSFDWQPQTQTSFSRHSFRSNLKSIVESEDAIVYIVLLGCGTNQDEHFRKMEGIVTTDLNRSSHKDDQSILAERRLNVCTLDHMADCTNRRQLGYNCFRTLVLLSFKCHQGRGLLAPKAKGCQRKII
jgi:hypothetical protein